MKKALSLTLALVICLSVMAFPASAIEAAPTASTVLVNGKNVAFDAYLINGNNYFKLRDLAYTLNGTAKQFSVGWDGANNAISLSSGQAYVAVGGEMEGKGSGTKTPAPTTSKIIKDGVEVQFTAYLIDGNNYFKLRDIGAAFDFGVDWDGAKNTIVIDTGKGYTPEQPTAPPIGSIDAALVGNWQHQGSSYSVITSRTEIFYYDYIFREDGTFQYFYRPGAAAYEWSGNYTASDGKIYITELYRHIVMEDGSVNKEQYVDKIMEYEFGTDDKGAYLKMPGLSFNADSTYVEISRGVNFRKL